MFEKITENVEIHQTLPDIPNLPTENLKKEWDKGNRIIKEAFNKQVDELIKLQESLKIKIITGQECPINFYIDGKQVFLKRVDCGNLTDNSDKYIESGLDMTKITIIELNGMAIDTIANNHIPVNIPFNDFLNIGTYIDKNRIRIRSNDNRSTYRAYVNIYYTKNEEV